jgi:hypothetical protein
MKVFADKECIVCGTTFNRRVMPNGRLEGAREFGNRRHCSRSCGNTRKNIKAMSYLWRSRKMRGPKCEACGAQTRLHSHHCDQDQTNNDQANIQTLCSYCHNFWHATAKRRGKTVAGRMPCLV